MEMVKMNDLEIKNTGVLLHKNVEKIELELLREEQIECPVVHRFGPGVYIRELSVKAGTFMIGHHHKTDYTDIMLKGVVKVVKDNGSVETIRAPYMAVGNPGRKIGWVVEDMVWLNIFPTEERDVEKLEEMLLDKSDGWKHNDAIRRDTGKIMREEDRDDFKKMLAEIGVDESTVRTQSENKLDQIPMPYGAWSFKIDKSPIEGQGVFATANIGDGESIGPARISGMRTPLGRFTNHSKNPNAVMIENSKGDVYLFATGNISGSVGGYNGEEITIDYRQFLGQRRKLCQA